MGETISGEEEKRDIVFFFGAGASVDAGIPDTYQFVELFKPFIKKKSLGLYKQLLRILKIRESFNERNLGVEKKQVDVEQLLDTLDRLLNKNKEVLLDFYKTKVFDSSLREESFSELKKLLEEFIREKVIVEEEKLEYLKELLKFDPPLEIYSTNYDTCIEQLSHINHRRYTDGFDTYWNKENFGKQDFDVKHYKMHGSIIWYENKKTKEYVKIPVHPFFEGKQVELKLIYGEDVRPLLIYPAQKLEYIEPLTELQLMFKQRLMKEDTKLLVVVGYSFRDDYIVQMLWDAGRINDDLHIVLIAPNAQEHFENKLKFVDKDREIPSRIYNRVICLPYPFSTVISQLKNHYLRELGYIPETEKRNIRLENQGAHAQVRWDYLLMACINCEFSAKVEYILEEKIKKGWSEVPFSLPQERLVYGVRAMLHSVIAKDGFEDKWLKRVNESLKIFSIENLQVPDMHGSTFSLGFGLDTDTVLNLSEIADKWINPILNERNNKLDLLSSKFESKLEKTEESFKHLEKVRDYLAKLTGRIKWEDYLKLRSKAKERDSIINLLNRRMDVREGQRLVLSIERRELKKVLGGSVLQFELQTRKNRRKLEKTRTRN